MIKLGDKHSEESRAKMRIEGQRRAARRAYQKGRESMRLRSTHTFAELAISESAWNEIAELLRLAGYDHVFIDGAIDMHGIGLTVRPEGEHVEHYGDCPVSQWTAVRGPKGAPECTCGQPRPGDLVGGRYLIQEKLSKERGGER